MVELGPVTMTAAWLGSLVLLTALTLQRRSQEDQGDGLAVVILPPPSRPNTVRLMVFLGLLMILSLVIVGNRLYLAAAYDSAVLRIAEWDFPSPSSLNPYYSHLEPSLRLMIAGSFLILAPVLRADPLRRLSVALHSVLYLAISAPMDALIVVWAASSRLPVGFYGLEGLGVNLALGGLVMLHLFFTTWQLPKPSLLAAQRGERNRDNLRMALVLVVVLAAFGILVAVGAANVSRARPLTVLLAFTTYSICWTLVVVILALIQSSARVPPVGEDFPPLHVITPAFNEASGIAATLRSIDNAATRYPGRVRVTLANDGSTDNTVQVATAIMREFRSAEGEVITVLHGGKSRALNAALARVRDGICVRIDADVVVDELAFVHTPRWFRDPSVGVVGGGTTPRMGRSWIHRMRLLECLSSFYFARFGLMAVDGISCIPGTYQAFRAEPARAVGGNVEGMNGEDADLTMQLGRMGYRAVIDLDIHIYEDTPNTIRQLREQRVRWYRAGSHIFARHGSAFTLATGPKLWFNTTRLMAMRFLAVLRPVLILYIVVLAAEQPTQYRNLWFAFVLYGSSVVPTFLVCSVVAVRYRLARYLPWFLLWYPAFVVLRRLIVVESFISMPTRPGVGQWGHRSSRATANFPSSAYQEMG